MSTFSLQMLRALFLATILAGALAGSAMAQALDARCALPSEPEGIPAALDAAITGPADKDRACMKALLIPEARDLGRLDRPRQSPWPRHVGRKAAEVSH
jgi:hypothetical protein